MSVDLFGLQREKLIKKSGVREVFTPHKPIESLGLFLGRQEEVSKIIEQLNTPGQHAILYGDRGVGKSSLANIASELLFKHLIEGRLCKKRCDSTDTFETILATPLQQVGVNIDVTETNHSSLNKGNLGIDTYLLKGGLGLTDSKSTKTNYTKHLLSPSWVFEKIGSLKGLLVIDEADAISNREDRIRLAELVKQLSDGGSEFKILIVGIAETAEMLTAAHPSVHRCLKETKLKRMKDEELKQIIHSGAEKINLKFTEEIIKEIVQLSSGYPHFTHLLSLKCAEEAIATKRKVINKAILEAAIMTAVQDAEGTLKRKYDDVARSHRSDMYKIILFAATKINKIEFNASELRENVSKISRRDINQQELNNYLQKLVSDSENTIIKRLAKGIYRFNDPRMPSFIRILNYHHPYNL